MERWGKVWRVRAISSVNVMEIKSVGDVVLFIAFVASKAFGWCLISFSVVTALMAGVTGELIFWTAMGLVLLGIGEFSLLRLMANGNE